MNLDLSPESTAYRDRIRSLASDVVAPAAAGIDRDDEFPRDVIRVAAGERLLGVTIDPEWGGAGRNYLDYALAIEAIGEASATVAVVLAVCNSLVAEPIARYGTPAQKERWLRPLVRGEAIGAFALSEIGAGTDVSHLRTRATRQAGGSYLVSGEKAWVANAEAADLALVVASDPEHGEAGATVFLIPLSSPGVKLGSRNEWMGVRGLGSFDLCLDEVEAGPDQVLGQPGEGFSAVRWALVGGRVAIAAQALGLGQAAIDVAVDYAKRRRTFGQAVASYQAIQWMIADAATALEAARVLTYKAATLRHVEREASAAASMAKLHASEAAMQAADCAVQVLGAAGYAKGSTAERLFRDARALEIYQGTSEAQRMIISRHVIE